MNRNEIERMVADWEDVYKKGQLTLWILLAIYDGRKYAAQITEFMDEATNGAFEVQEQSLYRALRRFSAMGLVTISEEQSPNSGPKRKYYELTDGGEVMLSLFVQTHISPLFELKTATLLQKLAEKGTRQ